MREQHSTRKYFDKSALPPARGFYERELVRLSRANRKGWAQANCPFHRSKGGFSFSVNLDSGGFHCFGCDVKGGDVIAFVRRRYRLNFKEAAQQLGAWGDITAEERTSLVRRRQEREWNRAREAERTQADRRERLQLRDELLTTVRLYHELDGKLHELGPAGSEAERCWSALPPTLDCWRLEESAYCHVAGLENPCE